MKKIITQSASKLWMVVLFSCLQLFAMAQQTTAADIKDDAESFFSQYWVWVVGGIILLILLIALFSGGSKKHKQIVKTTVIKEEEVV